MKQKTRILIYILVGAAVVVMGVLGMLAARSGGSDSAGKSIDLGQKYLVELSYDKAVIAFTEAIDIDPTNIDAYKGIAQAYEGMGDTEKAIEWLRKGYDLTGDSSLKTELDRLMLAADVAPDESAEDTPITAPMLENLTQAQAEGVCRENGIAFEFRYEESNEVTKDYVISQSIKANDEIPKGETLVITVCSGTVQVEMPDLAGLTEEDAKKACENAGLKYAVTYAGSDTVEKGVVSAQTIPAGAKVSQGIAAPFTVSDGYTVKAELVAENLEFDYLAGFEKSGWAFAVRGNKGGYVNTDGKFVEVYNNVPELEWGTYWTRDDGIGIAEGDSEFFNFDSPFKVSEEGIYPYYDGSKWGYANINTGKMVTACKYDTITAFNCGRGLAAVISDDSWRRQFYSIIDANGNEIKTDIEGSVLTSGYINNIAIIGGMFESNMYDINGNIIEKNIQNQVCGGQFTYGKDIAITYQVGSDVSPIYVITPDLKKTVLLKPISDMKMGYSMRGYSGTGFFYGKYAFFDNWENNTTGIIDINGNILCSGKKWASWYYFQGGNNSFVYDTSDSSWYMIDQYGNKIGDVCYEEGNNVVFGYAAVKNNGKWGVVNANNELCVDYKYDGKLGYFYKISNNVIHLFKNNGTIVAVGNNGTEYFTLNGEVCNDYDNFNDNYAIIVTKTENGTYSFYKITQ